jgi:hypothetical protein
MALNGFQLTLIHWNHIKISSLTDQNIRLYLRIQSPPCQGGMANIRVEQLRWISKKLIVFLCDYDIA